MMSSDPVNEPVMISALEHYSYCPRQCALIHLEQVWDENIYTMRGRDVHENVDEASEQLIEGVRYERALPLWSKRLNLVGKADLVEFHDGVPYPVEYKSGRHRAGRHEEIQLCAQAVCLEEMLGVGVPKGALYWHGSRKRKEIVFDQKLRNRLEEVVAAVHDLISSRLVPQPVNDKRCQDCSLRGSCLPEIIGNNSRRRNLKRTIFITEEGE